MSEDRKFKGIWIPREIWLDKNLNVLEKVMLVEIDSLDNESGCFARNQHFCEFLGVNERRVQQLIKGLKDKGLITVSFIWRKGSKEIEGRVLRVSKDCALYSEPLPPEEAPEVVQKIAPPGEKNCVEVVQNISPPGAKKCAVNNTSFRNTNKSNTEIESDFPDATHPAAPVPYEKIKAMYNEICKSFSRCTAMSDARKKAIKARFASGYTVEDFRREFEKAEASPFLKGHNGRNWIASFDWLIKDANMAKVLDGNYDDHAAGSPPPKTSDLDDLF